MPGPVPVLEAVLEALGHGSELQMPATLLLLPGARSLCSAPDLESQGSGSGSKAAGESAQEPAALPGWEPGLSGPPCGTSVLP